MSTCAISQLSQKDNNLCGGFDLLHALILKGEKQTETIKNNFLIITVCVCYKTMEAFPYKILLIVSNIQLCCAILIHKVSKFIYLEEKDNVKKNICNGSLLT